VRRVRRSVVAARSATSRSPGRSASPGSSSDYDHEIARIGWVRLAYRTLESLLAEKHDLLTAEEMRRTTSYD